MREEEARRRFAQARVARLATAGGGGRPRLVPVTFALPEPDVVAFAVDHKPKSTPRLQRLADIRAQPAVALLVDAYDDDWSQLWWVRADADAEVLSAGDARAGRGLDALVARYRQYERQRPSGPVVWCRVVRWVGWSAAPG